MIVDHMGTVLYVSGDCADYISLTPSEITGHTLYEVGHSEDQETIKKNLELSNADLIEGNQVGRQFCVRVRSSMTGMRTQVSKFGGYNMIHISGFLKVASKDDGVLQSNISANNKNYVVMPSGMQQNYQVLGLVAECHLIESPVIMELTIQHSTFSGTSTLDMKFTSVDIRVKKVIGFDAKDMVGQKIIDFFHPRDFTNSDHHVCQKKLMMQGRAVSPVYRFLTKSGEWIWMQMSVTLTYVPGTKIPYAANFVFRVINVDHSETGKYNLVEHNEEYVMASNSSIPEQMKSYLPVPANERENKPKENENNVSSVISDTPLSDSAQEAFFQARNIAMDTYGTGVLPARLENGLQPVKMIPDFTENPTLESVFVPPTMSSAGGTTRGPEIYTPCTSNGCFNFASPVQQQQQQQQSNLSNAVSHASNFTTSTSFPENHSTIPHEYQPDQGLGSSPVSYHSPQTNYSPSSGYMSSPCQPPLSAKQSSPEDLSLQQIDNLVDDIDLKLLETLTPTTSAPCNVGIPVTCTTNVAPQNVTTNFSSHSSHLFVNTNPSTTLPPTDQSLNDILSSFAPEGQNLWPANSSSNSTNFTQTASTAYRHARPNGTNNPLLFNSSVDQIIDELLVETSNDANSYPDLPIHNQLLTNNS